VPILFEGALERLAIVSGAPASYRLSALERSQPASAAGSGDPPADLPLNPLLGQGITIEFLGAIHCCHCGRQTARSFSEGYCYPCFRRLARCDLCVMRPERCHFAAGTCREPTWGEDFCMQPHTVYLANATGPKVGITRPGHEIGRWLDQGAVQGLRLLRAATRQQAGLAEVAIARRISDRTDWHALVRETAPPIDLIALAGDVRAAGPALPEGVEWLTAELPIDLSYPVLRYPVAARRLRLEKDPRVTGRLLGMKGQFLLLDSGVFNVRQHRAYRVRVSTFPLAPLRDAGPPTIGSTDQQMEMFGE